MEAARPHVRRRRPSRRDEPTALDARLVRVGLLLVVPGLMALLLALSAPGTLPRPALQPLFDAKAAGVLASTLALEYPSRVPGTPEADDAARWYRETIAGLGISTEEDSWSENLPDLGRVTLRNVVSVVPGRSDATILVVAHRDNGGPRSPAADNASGTAALLELARTFAPQGAATGPVPQHTLVFVSTDGGAYGGAGAARFAAVSPLARAALAAVVIDGLERPGRARLAIAGDAVASPPRVLVRTAMARVEEQTGEPPLLPSLATQLLDLGAPFAGAEQGRLLGRGIPAVTLTTTGSLGGARLVVPGQFPGTPQLGRMGRAVEALVDSLDASVATNARTSDRIFLGDRALSGWAVRLLLVLLVVPIALAAADLAARARRRGLRLAPGLRALRSRVLVWIGAAILLGAGALLGVFPTGADLPLPEFTSIVSSPDVLPLTLLLGAFVLLWALARRRLAPRVRSTSDDRLAGMIAGLLLLVALAIVLALAKPYALAFVLPALYAWPWIPLDRSSWRGMLLFLVGLSGPFVGLVLLADQVDIPLLRSPLYVCGLLTVGYLSLGSLVGLIVFATVGSQFATLAFGRYAPYAGGLEPPPRGVVRQLVARAAGPIRR